MKNRKQSSSALLIAAAAQAASRGGVATLQHKPSPIAGFAGVLLGFFRHRASLAPSNQSGGSVPSGGFKNTRVTPRRLRVLAKRSTSTGGTRHG